MVEDSFLTQVITQPTRENIILDLQLVSDPDLIRNCEVGEKLNGCDHHIIRFNVSVQHKLVENPTLMPDYRKANFNLARELLPPAAWGHINGDINISTIEDTGTVFRDKLLEVERTIVPMKSRRVNGAVDPPWMNMEIKRAINMKKRNYNLM